MKTKLAVIAAAAGVLLAASAFSQPYGMGPGYGAGYGMGPGMMGGYGPGGGMGPGGGYGPGMMGPGMMGYGPGYGYGIADLTKEQRAKLGEIQEQTQRKQWALMQSMHELRWSQANAYRDGKIDEKAAREAYDGMANLRKQMFENGLEARKRMEAVLTPKQRDSATGG